MPLSPISKFYYLLKLKTNIKKYLYIKVLLYSRCIKNIVIMIGYYLPGIIGHKHINKMNTYKYNTCKQF